MSVQMETGPIKTPSPFMEALYQAAKGGALGAVVVTAVTPLLYAKNRLQTQQPFIFEHCFRGAPLLAANLVPQTAMAVAVNALMKKYGFKKLDGEELTTREKMFAASCAGAAAAVISTPGEFVVQNYQNGWQKSMVRVAVVTLKEHGPRAFMRGTGALVGREVLYASGYLVFAGMISEEAKKHFKSQHASDAIGATGSAVVVGTLTASPDTLRANKQWLERMWPYMKTIKVLGPVRLISGVVPRIAAIAISNFIMMKGLKKGE